MTKFSLLTSNRTSKDFPSKAPKMKKRPFLSKWMKKIQLKKMLINGKQTTKKNHLSAGTDKHVITGVPEDQCLPNSTSL